MLLCCGANCYECMSRIAYVLVALCRRDEEKDSSALEWEAMLSALNMVISVLSAMLYYNYILYDVAHLIVCSGCFE